MELESKLVRVIYETGDRTRSLNGTLVGETEDRLFLIVVRPLGDRVLISKSSIRAITEEGRP
jgi:hypothetical protein